MNTTLNTMNITLTGQEIRTWRKAKQLSRIELAGLCCVNASTVHNWESGRNKPHGAAFQTLQRLINDEVSRLAVNHAAQPPSAMSKQEAKVVDMIRSRACEERANQLAAKTPDATRMYAYAANRLESILLSLGLDAYPPITRLPSNNNSPTPP